MTTIERGAMSPHAAIARMQADRPSFHSGGEARWDALPETLAAIARVVGDGASTLEIGCGASTVVFVAAGAKHLAISPDPREHDRVREYCQRIGLDVSCFETIAGSSEQVLPAMTGRRLDVAMIDGDHKFPIPIIDWYYTARMLDVGGYLIVDDIPVRAVAPTFHHMAMEPNWELDSILDDRAAMFRLVDDQIGDEWPTQAFNRGTPDFSFVPLPQRVGIVARHHTASARRTLAARYPRARDAWHTARDRMKGAAR